MDYMKLLIPSTYVYVLHPFILNIIKYVCRPRVYFPGVEISYEVGSICRPPTGNINDS